MAFAMRLKMTNQESESAEEVLCVQCEHVSVYRIYFIGKKLYSQCALCHTRYDVEDALLARAEALAPPSPPVPEKKKLWAIGKKKETTVKKPA